MAKILVIAMGGHGHINPTLALSEDLQRRGHQIIYGCPEEFRATVAAVHVPFYGLDSLMMKAERPRKLDRDTMLRMLPKRFLSEALHLLPQLDELVRKEHPDLVLYDNMSLATRMITELHGIPKVALFTSYAANEHFSVIDELGPLPNDVATEYEQLMRQMTEQYAVRPLPFRDMFGHGEDLNIVFMPKLWQPHGETFDARCVFVGPCLGSRLNHETLPPEILLRRPLLFISLGSVFNDQPEFYRACIEAFGDSHWHIVMATGMRTDHSGLGSVPENFTILRHAPQLEILQHASLFITHGGMNSTMEGLSCGVPLVAKPQMFEQALTARRIEAFGVGASMADRDVTADELRATVDRIAGNPSVREKAAAVRSAIAGAGGLPRAAEAVELYLEKLEIPASVMTSRRASMAADGSFKPGR